MRVEESKANEDLEVDMNDLVSRQVYDFENKKISFMGRRATECKNNTWQPKQILSSPDKNNKLLIL